MGHLDAYQADLAYIHDQGFAGRARGSAPGLLELFKKSGIGDGPVVDLGCGSGISARELADRGYQVTGVDIFPAMIDMARRQAPIAHFHAITPRKAYVIMTLKLPQSQQINHQLEEAGITTLTYCVQWRHYRAKIGGPSDEKQRAVVSKLIAEAAEGFGKA